MSRGLQPGMVHRCRVGHLCCSGTGACTALLQVHPPPRHTVNESHSIPATAGTMPKHTSTAARQRSRRAHNSALQQGTHASTRCNNRQTNRHTNQQRQHREQPSRACGHMRVQRRRACVVLTQVLPRTPPRTSAACASPPQRHHSHPASVCLRRNPGPEGGASQAAPCAAPPYTPASQPRPKLPGAAACWCCCCACCCCCGGWCAPSADARGLLPSGAAVECGAAPMRHRWCSVCGRSCLPYSLETWAAQCSGNVQPPST